MGPMNHHLGDSPLRTILVTTLVAALVLTASACFDTPQPDCAFLCSVEGECPDGYRCASDGICKRLDLADNAVCSNVSRQDAAPAPDAMPDAMTDAMPDAMPAAMRAAVRVATPP